MDFLAPITAGINAIGNVLGAKAGADSNERSVAATNASNQQIARENTAFQERMANTAHQREMADLKAAGLNPILAAGRGGAAAPTGSVAQMQAAQSGGIIAEGVRGASASAAQALQMEKQLANLDADTANKVTEGLNKLEQNHLIQEQVKGQRLTNAVTQATTPEILKQAGFTTESKRIATAREQAELGYQQERAKFDKENIVYDKRVQQVGDALGAVTSALNLSNLFRARPGGAYDNQKRMDKMNSTQVNDRIKNAYKNRGR